MSEKWTGLPLFCVLRFDEFQVDDGVKAEHMTLNNRRVFGTLEEAEAEAARLNARAPTRVFYFARRLVHPGAEAPSGGER